MIEFFTVLNIYVMPFETWKTIYFSVLGAKGDKSFFLLSGEGLKQQMLTLYVFNSKTFPCVIIIIFPLAFLEVSKSKRKKTPWSHIKCLPVIFPANAVIQPNAMMIELFYALVASATVFCVLRSLKKFFEVFLYQLKIERGRKMISENRSKVYDFEKMIVKN